MSFVATLSSEQKIAALAYRGDENHGDATMAIKFSPKKKQAPVPPKHKKGKKR